MVTTMTRERRAAASPGTRSTVKNERLQALLEELAAWLMLAGFAVACLIVFALAIQV